jgi:putative acetyltransferase
MPGVISPDDPRASDVRALFAAHLDFAHANSEPHDVHALDIEGLVDPAVPFFSFRVDGELIGVGALKRLDDVHAEVKSMHTAAAARGQGVGAAMLDHLVAVARRRGCRRVSLETGTANAFAPARALYASNAMLGVGGARSDWSTTFPQN